MFKRFGIVLFPFFIMFCGCVTMMDLGEFNSVDRNITLREVVNNPENYVGKLVLWGGKILKVTNKKEGTLIEVLQLPLDRNGRPRDIDKSAGRFLVLQAGYLDAAIYRKGRLITVVGEVQGVKSKPLDEIQYDYPFLIARKLHLWKTPSEELMTYRSWPLNLYWRRYSVCGPYWWGWTCW